MRISRFHAQQRSRRETQLTVRATSHSATLPLCIAAVHSNLTSPRRRKNGHRANEDEIEVAAVISCITFRNNAPSKHAWKRRRAHAEHFESPLRRS